MDCCFLGGTNISTSSGKLQSSNDERSLNSPLGLFVNCVKNRDHILMTFECDQINILKGFLERASMRKLKFVFLNTMTV